MNKHFLISIFGGFIGGVVVILSQNIYNKLFNKSKPSDNSCNKSCNKLCNKINKYTQMETIENQNCQKYQNHQKQKNQIETDNTTTDTTDNTTTDILDNLDNLDNLNNLNNLDNIDKECNTVLKNIIEASIQNADPQNNTDIYARPENQHQQIHVNYTDYIMPIVNHTMSPRTTAKTVENAESNPILIIASLK